ncbi:MAG: FtsX-like permease family protein [Candidatus Methanomarinus sp.]|uniref:FtsX-like permease family protein n=1 Tax=Candidatus Methanomarinus sp. TaxID=3386244 RepID=A0AC61SA25_9EURY|nr:MAG: FtsX-like permease family protein [ANME-2 cluster archaeon]
MINFIQSLRIAIGSIRSAKMRSILTTLGIVIGVAAVIANVSLGASFNQYFADVSLSAGSNYIVVFGKEPNLLHDNEMKLIDNTPGILGISPFKEKSSEVTYFSTSKHINVIGVAEDLEEITNIELEDGAFLNDKDRYVAVIGHDIAYDKFDRKIFTQNSIDITFRKKDGSTITKTFMVKGIIEKSKESFFDSGIGDNVILIPVSTLNDILGENDYGAIVAMASDLDTIEETDEKIDKRLARHFGVSTRDMDNEDAKPYSLNNQAEDLEMLGQLSDALAALLTAVSLIALIVGSIGIMNIMLVTVTERTQEIGILKSLGFTNLNVLFLFIVESVVLSVFGGLLGTGLGVVGAYGAQSLMKLPNVFPIELIVVGFAVSVIVGLIAGVYPANKAARMNTVDALRSE